MTNARLPVPKPPEEDEAITPTRRTFVRNTGDHDEGCASLRQIGLVTSSRGVARFLRHRPGQSCFDRRGRC